MINPLLKYSRERHATSETQHLPAEELDIETARLFESTIARNIERVEAILGPISVDSRTIGSNPDGFSGINIDSQKDCRSIGAYNVKYHKVIRSSYNDPGTAVEITGPTRKIMFQTLDDMNAGYLTMVSMYRRDSEADYSLEWDVTMSGPYGEATIQWANVSGTTGVGHDVTSASALLEDAMLAVEDIVAEIE